MHACVQACSMNLAIGYVRHIVIAMPVDAPAMKAYRSRTWPYPVKSADSLRGLDRDASSSVSHGYLTVSSLCHLRLGAIQMTDYSVC